MGDGVQRIVTILNAAKGKKDVAAIVVPRPFAEGLTDELYPLRPLRTWGLPAVDRVNELDEQRVRSQRSKWLRDVREGGYIGTLFDIPLFVLEDVVICALDGEELAACGLSVDAVKTAEGLE